MRVRARLGGRRREYTPPHPLSPSRFPSLHLHVCAAVASSDSASARILPARNSKAGTGYCFWQRSVWSVRWSSAWKARLGSSPCCIICFAKPKEVHPIPGFVPPALSRSCLLAACLSSSLFLCLSRLSPDFPFVYLAVLCSFERSFLFLLFPFFFFCFFSFLFLFFFFLHATRSSSRFPD